MLSLRLKLSVILYFASGWIVSLVLLLSATCCHAQEPPSLLPGYYVYFGPRPGKQPPRAFTVGPQGEIVWQSLFASDTSPEALRAEPAKKLEPETAIGKKTSESNLQWDSNEYPIIKWKAHPITTIPGGIAQLTTTYENRRIKYRLTLFKIARVPYSITVEFVDKDGFKVEDFSVLFSQFHSIPGTSLVEALGETWCEEPSYQRAQDYIVR